MTHIETHLKQIIRKTTGSAEVNGRLVCQSTLAVMIKIKRIASNHHERLAFQQTERIASTESGRWKWRSSNIEKTVKIARQRKTTYSFIVND
jgi:hypothetical protein